MAAHEIHAEFQNGAHEKYKLDTNSYMIPTNIDTNGLSRMINDLLGLKNYVPFDIIFNNERLRTTISEKLDEHKITPESSITLTYILEIGEPVVKDVDNTNDWINSLSYAENLEISALCCYDGYISIYKTPSMDKVLEFVVDKKSSTAIHIVDETPIDSKFETVVGQINGIVEIYLMSFDGGNFSSQIIASNNRTSDTISAISSNKTGSLLITGGYEKTICLYKNTDIITEDQSHDYVDVYQKRKSNKIKAIQPIKYFNGHTKPVTDLHFVSHTPNVFISSSMDGNFILWDVSVEASVLSCNTHKPITCLSTPNASKICIGHDSGCISIWDIRANSDIGTLSNIEKQFHSSKICSNRNFSRLVSDISWNPLNDNIISAVGLDGYLSIIDIRSPNQTLKTVQCQVNGSSDRGTCCCWINDTELLCTTASGQVMKYKYNF